MKVFKLKSSSDENPIFGQIFENLFSNGFLISEHSTDFYGITSYGDGVDINDFNISNKDEWELVKVNLIIVK